MKRRAAGLLYQRRFCWDKMHPCREAILFVLFFSVSRPVPFSSLDPIMNASKTETYGRQNERTILENAFGASRPGHNEY
ncbi:hypothetical protein ACRALDRAFT_209515 [Sodiomyces alcalophilus JCM 7366]|uniref:uncharacterized protein n=1 Tax=Sodiomyces alcalophilus JCM 7366 TaxID=591952 RepID=UPI0039B3B0D9